MTIFTAEYSMINRIHLYDKYHMKKSIADLKEIMNITRVIETWLLLAVLKVPIGGDGSNIQNLPFKKRL